MNTPMRDALPESPRTRAALREVTIGLMEFGDGLRKLCPEVKFPPTTWRIDSQPLRKDAS